MASRLRIFPDRAAAGRALAQALQTRSLTPPVLVLALPRGGVPVAHEIALALGAPLDVMLVRKVGMPGQPELAIGAIAAGNIVVREPRLKRDFPQLDAVFDRLAAQEMRELERRERTWRSGLPPLNLTGRTVIIVDDGLATGATMLAAVRAARQAGAATLIATAPVGSSTAAALLRPEADVVILQIPRMLLAVGEWYQRFEQLEDSEVTRILALHRDGGEPTGKSARQTPPEGRTQEVSLETPGARLAGVLRLPADPCGVVIFAHGTGSSRLSPRNNYVAERLSREHLASLLFDLLTADEEALDTRTAQLRFDIPFLTERLLQATAWTQEQPGLHDLPPSYFGASTGAAAALAAAARLPAIRAIVSRGGRPDLAGAALAQVNAPTLLIVGGDDTEVLELNRMALAQLRCEASMEIIPHATHLFAEPGTLEQAASLAGRFIALHLRRATRH
jgi:putative phosphoribosyl transferase